MNNKYWAFISYSSKDNRLGSWLHKRIENYQIPNDFRGQKLFDGAILGKNLRPIFRDRDELSGSSNLGLEINKALGLSRFLIVLCSKNSAKSEWVNKEINSFMEMGKGDNILALILDGEPNSTSKGQPENECFPPALQYPYEPIAGDLRKDGDGKERGFLKVLAGITQLDFDKLYRRHEKALARKRAFITLISSFLLVLFAILTATAWIQTDKAVKAKEKEEIAKKETIIERDKAIKSEKLALESKELAEKAKENEAEQRLIAERAKDEESKHRKLAEEALIESDKSKKIALQRLAQMYYEKGLISMKNGDPIESLKYLSESLRNSSDHLGSRQLLFSILTQNNFPLPIAKEIKLESTTSGLLGETSNSSFYYWKDEIVYHAELINGELKSIPVYQSDNNIYESVINYSSRRIVLWNRRVIELLEYNSDREVILKSVFNIDGWFQSMKFSPDGKWLFISTINNIYIYDLENKKLQFEQKKEDKNSYLVKTVSFNSLSTHFIFIDSEKIYRVKLVDGSVESWASDDDLFLGNPSSYDSIKSLFLNKDASLCIVAKNYELIPVYLETKSFSDESLYIKTLRAKELTDTSYISAGVEKIINLPDDRIYLSMTYPAVLDFSKIDSENFTWEDVEMVRTDNQSYFVGDDNSVISSNSRFVINQYSNSFQVFDILSMKPVTTDLNFLSDIDDILITGKNIITIDDKKTLSVRSINGTGWATLKMIWNYFRNYPGSNNSKENIFVIPHDITPFEPQLLVNNKMVELDLDEKYKAQTLEFTENGDLLLSYVNPVRGNGGILKFYPDNIMGPGVEIYRGDTNGIIILPDNYLVINSLFSNDFKLFNLNSNYVEDTIEIDKNMSSYNFFVDLANNSLAYTHSTNAVYIKDINRSQTKTFTINNEVDALCLSRDGKKLAVYDKLGWLYIYDSISSELLHKQQYDETYISHLKFNNSSDHLAFANSNLNVVDLTGNIIYKRNLPASVKHLSFDDDSIRVSYRSSQIIGGETFIYKIPKEIKNDDLIKASNIFVSSSKFGDNVVHNLTPYEYYKSIGHTADNWLNLRSAGLLKPKFILDEGDDLFTINLFAQNIGAYLLLTNPEIDFPAHNLTYLLQAIKYTNNKNNDYRPELSRKLIDSVKDSIETDLEFSLLSMYTKNVGEYAVKE